jgi:hypothetical protein
MNLKASIIGGLAGAVAVTIIHEILKQSDSQAPRMDKLGMQAIAKGLDKAGEAVPSKKSLFGMALVAELLSNTFYYALAGIGKRKDAMSKGSALGLIAGFGTLLLPKPMGLNTKHSNKTVKTQVMSVGLYLLGGMIASKVTEMLDRREDPLELN